MNLLKSLSYSDITTGSWFKTFATESQNKQSVPLAIDIYYDDWKVSHLNSIGGLYFSIANFPKLIHWKVKNKFLITLVPYGRDLQNLIPTILRDLKLNNPPLTYT